MISLTEAPETNRPSSFSISTEVSLRGNSDSDAEVDSSMISTQPIDDRNIGGRPIGSTIAARREKKTLYNHLVNVIATEYTASKDAHGLIKLPNGHLDKIIDEKMKEYGWVASRVPKETIYDRHKKKKYNIHNNGPTSPAQPLDDGLVELLHQLADMNKPLSTEVLDVKNCFAKVRKPHF